MEIMYLALTMTPDHADCKRLTNSHATRHRRLFELNNVKIDLKLVKAHLKHGGSKCLIHGVYHDNKHQKLAQAGPWGHLGFLWRLRHLLVILNGMSDLAMQTVRDLLMAWLA